MKKFFAVLLAAVMILGCVSALAEGEKIALVTDVGTIDDAFEKGRKLLESAK